MLKADPFSQLKLLDVQELDSSLDALRHQFATLPELAEIKSAETARAALTDRAKDLQVSVDDLTRDQKKADADVEQVKARRKRDQDRLDSGQVTSPKDLEHLQHELVSLQRRVTELEDVELEVMEKLEAAQSELSRLQTEIAGHDTRIAELIVSRDVAAAEIRDRGQAATGERKVTASGVPSELLALYDKLRASKGGVGAAALRQRRCGGCGLELSPADLNAIRGRADDDVVRCEECARILVRTADSGL